MMGSGAAKGEDEAEPERAKSVGCWDLDAEVPILISMAEVVAAGAVASLVKEEEEEE